MNPYMSKPKNSSDIEIPESLLKHLMTESELKMLKNRYLIIQLLEGGLSIRKVAEEAGVGTDTVVRVSKILRNESLRKKLDIQKNVGQGGNTTRQT